MANGILIVDKPAGWTSQDVAAKLRGVFHERRIGPSGTLDPMATGLLPLAFGEATKFSADLLHADKAYRAVATLGVETDTGDRTGTVLKTHEVSVTLDEVKAAAAKLTGPIKQVPPMYSALKRDGVALYRLARQGETVEREPRLVTIYRFDILSLDGNTVEMECVVENYVAVLSLEILRQYQLKWQKNKTPNLL